MQNTLRTKLIRLAHENPALRADLLPLLNKQAGAKVLILVDRAKKLFAVRVDVEMSTTALGKTTTLYDLKRAHSAALVYAKSLAQNELAGHTLSMEGPEQQPFLLGPTAWALVIVSFEKDTSKVEVVLERLLESGWSVAPARL